MLESIRAGSDVPSLALLDYFLVGYPLMPITLFIGLAVMLKFYATVFGALEESRKAEIRST